MMKNNLFSLTYASLSLETGEPTMRSSAELRGMQKEYIGRSDPNTFYVTVDPRPNSKVVWSHNTFPHFGGKALTFSGFFAAVHPFWLPIYAGMTELSLRLLRPTVNELGTRSLSLTANIPIRNKNGKYYWYNQVSFAGSFDKEGAMVEYINEFHRMAEFDRMVPAWPSLTFHGSHVSSYDNRLKEQVGELLDKALRAFFTPACYKLLHTYRVMKASNYDTSREGVSQYLEIRLQALDKGNVRLLSQARLAFPGAILTTVADFASFLNEVFGKPLDRRTRSGG